MYKINLYCVGDLKEKEFVQLCEEYKKRISRFAKINIYEIKEKNNLNDINLIVENESKDLISKINLNKTILFDVKGQQYSSEDFSDIVQNWFLTNSELNFIIGGSYGVSDEIKNNVKLKISLSKMTFPHRLFRIMALEQIYRAFTIINNVAYHK